MPHNQLDFVIPENHSISELVPLLQNNFTVRLQDETVIYRVFYDTFDWRLYKNGSVLEMHEDGRSRKIYWRAGKDAKLKIQLGLRNVPQLASSLPACEFQQQLQAVVSVRELTPCIKLRIKRLPLVVLDKDEKVVVRINLDKYWYSPSKLRADKVLGKRLTIKAVKGYPKDYQKVEAFLQAMKLHLAQDNMMKLALLAKGVSAGEYTTNLNFLLDPEMPAEQAFNKILLRLLEVMQQNTTGCLNGRDTEFMHDYRDSILKTRCALMQIGDVLPQAVDVKYNDFFSMLDKLTAPVRDHDVLLLQLGNCQESIKEPEQQLRSFREYLLYSRKEVQKKLIEELKSSQYRENIKQWRDYLKHSGTQGISSDKLGKVVYKLADELILDTYKQTIEQGKAVADNDNAETQQELHKAFNKLCYLMEFFRSLYPAGKMRVLIQLSTNLRDDLGDSYNLNTHIGMAEEYIKQSMNEHAKNTCEQLVKQLQQRQYEASESFKRHYAAYSSSNSQKKFRDMFIDYYSGY